MEPRTQKRYYTSFPSTHDLNNKINNKYMESCTQKRDYVNFPFTHETFTKTACTITSHKGSYHKL